MILFDHAAYQRSLTLAGVPRPQALAHSGALQFALDETRAHVIANDAEADATIIRQLDTLSETLAGWTGQDMQFRQEIRRLLWFSLGALAIVIVLLGALIWLAL